MFAATSTLPSQIVSPPFSSLAKILKIPISFLNPFLYISNLVQWFTYFHFGNLLLANSAVIVIITSGQPRFFFVWCFCFRVTIFIILWFYLHLRSDIHRNLHIALFSVFSTRQVSSYLGSDVLKIHFSNLVSKLNKNSKYFNFNWPWCMPYCFMMNLLLGVLYLIRIQPPNQDRAKKQKWMNGLKNLWHHWRQRLGE